MLEIKLQQYKNEANIQGSQGSIKSESRSASNVERYFASITRLDGAALDRNVIADAPCDGVLARSQHYGTSQPCPREHNAAISGQGVNPSDPMLSLIHI